jgi:hypothetical protein
LRLLNQPIPLQETLGLDVVDANGVRLHLNRTIPVQAFPYYRGNLPLGPVISWGTESPYDHDLDAGDTDSWHKAMKNNPIFGFERFYRGVYVADRSDFFDAPSGNNDWIVDAADITYYAGHGNPNCFTFTDHSKGPGTPATAVMDSDATKFWGNNAQEWFCMLSCNVLQQFDDNARLAFERWGPCFDGLHEMLAFSTEAYAGGVTGPFGAGFEEEFVKYMAGTGRNPFPETIQKAWFDAAMTTGPYGGSNLGRTGDPAVLGPIASGGIWDINGYWWGMGPVGPRIRAPQISGWYYLTQSN